MLSFAFYLLLVVSVVSLFQLGGVHALKPDGVDDDIWEMTKSLPLKYRIGQMTQLQFAYFIDQTTFTLKVEEFTRFQEEYGIGSVFDTPFSGEHMPTGEPGWSLEQWRAVLTQIQDVCLSTGAKIPMLYGLDTIHGANYVMDAVLLPQPIAMGATLNEEFSEHYGYIMAKDTRAAGIPWIFSPVLGIAAHPQWPRVYETMGEDTVISSVMGAAQIRGIQGFPPNLRADDRAAACMKHFVGYPVPSGGQDRASSTIPDRYLQEYFLPPFQAAVDAGVATTMEAYNEINGEPVVSSRKYLDDILRDQLGFKGLLVTDYYEIYNLVDWHKVSPTRKAAIELVMNQTSLDMSMVPWSADFIVFLGELVEEGSVPEERVNESCARILQTKKDLGLLDNPYPHNNQTVLDTVGSQEDMDFSLEAAREAVTLLKNEGKILPLDNTDSVKVMLTGAASVSLPLLNGGWTVHWQGASEGDLHVGVTIEQGMRHMVEGKEAEFSYVHSCDFSSTCDADRYADAVKRASESDYAVVVVGEPTYTEKVGNIVDFSLAADQYAMADAILKTGTPVILVLVEGRPRTLGDLAERSAAVLNAYLPGSFGGQAIAEIIFGAINPSGKSPYTYPKHQSLGGIRYWHKFSEEENYISEFPFGTGLSYTEFTYSDLTLSSSTVNPEQTIDVSVTIKNTGDRFGKEAVVLYLRQHYRLITPEVRRIKHFTKIGLHAGEEKVVQFQLNAYDMSYIGREDLRTIDNGKFSVYVGPLEQQFEMVSAHLYNADVKTKKNEPSDLPFDFNSIVSRILIVVNFALVGLLVASLVMKERLVKIIRERTWKRVPGTP